MRRFFRLPAISSAAWGGWLGLLATLWILSALQAWHPHFLPAAAMVGLLVGSSVTLLVVAAWRLAVGPRRLRAVTWLLLGLAPSAFFASFVLYGIGLASGRAFEASLPVRLLVPLGSSGFDLLARFAYPVRTEGETVVMISRPDPDAKARVAAMDRHVRAICGRLGVRPGPRKGHWIRGNLLDLTPHAVDGLCMTAADLGGPADAEGLTTLDRHEVAHLAIAGVVPGRFDDQPSVLVEGWAEANQGEDEPTLARRAWALRENGQFVPLRELVGPTWYTRHTGPAYVQGAALVNHLLREHGAAKFLELYRSCRRATVADDFRRVLGIGLEELDAAYWADVERIASPRTPPAERLRAFAVRAPADRAAWDAFLAEYLAAAATLTAPYEHVDMTTELVSAERDEKGREASYSTRSRERRDGDLWALSVTYATGGETALLATPARSFEAGRGGADGRWKIAEPPRDDPDRAYRTASRRIRTRSFSHEAALLLKLVEEPEMFAEGSRWTVTALERFTEGGRNLVRLRIEPDAPSSSPCRPMAFVFDADDRLALRSADLEVPGDVHMLYDCEYHRESGTPLLRSQHCRVVGKASCRDIRWRVIKRRFGPVPASAFTEAGLLDGPVDHLSPSSIEDGPGEWPRFRPACYLALASGAVMIVAGMLCGFLGGFRGQGTSRTGSRPRDIA